jgi:hypothetical protein
MRPPKQSKQRTYFQKADWEKINWEAVNAHLNSLIPSINTFITGFVDQDSKWSGVVELCELPNIKVPSYLKLIFWVKPEIMPRRKQMFYNGLPHKPYNFYARLNPDELIPVGDFVTDLKNKTSLHWERDKEGKDGILVYTHHPNYTNFLLASG